MEKLKTYTLQTGKKAKERLFILSSVCNPFTLSLLNKLPNLTGKNVLDIACGVGTMTYEFSKIVGIHGKVIGIDISKEQLNIAKDFINNKNCHNISFLNLAAEQLEQLDKKFDVVYCRFLLCHLRNPIDVFEKMIARLNSNGILILEEPTGYEPMFSYPTSLVFDKCKHIHLLQGKAFNTDFQIGRKLCHWLKNCDMNVTHDYLVQPILKTEYEKRQLWLGIQEMSDSLIEQGCISSNEIIRSINEIKQYSKNDNYHAAFVQYRQITANFSSTLSPPN